MTPATRITRTEVALRSPDALTVEAHYDMTSVPVGRPVMPSPHVELRYALAADPGAGEQLLMLDSWATAAELAQPELQERLDGAAYPLRATLVETTIEYTRKRGPKAGMLARYVEASLEF